jgi:hypothetical protein
MPTISSFKAMEDNEMNLTEGEIIEQIEQLDDGWWSGVGAGGSKSGMFPGRRSSSRETTVSNW